MFKVENLHKKIGCKTILHDLNFEIEHGQIGIFLGDSGVGKSTLLRVLNNLETYDSGKFTLDGAPLKLENVNKDHTVGMVFQHFNLFENLNVEENITLALVKLKGMSKQEAHLAAAALLERYDLSHLAQEPVQKLSGGQKQRLAIARTIALNPKITCLDEPTSALDPRLTGEVASCVNGLSKDRRIVLLATHDMSFVEQLNGKIFFMQKGTIVETCLTTSFKTESSHYPLLQRFLCRSRF